MSLSDFIKQLQSRPYEQRVRILWGTTIIAALILIGVWGLLAKLGPARPLTPNNFWGTTKQNLEDTKTELSELQQSLNQQLSLKIPPLDSYQPVSLLDFSFDEQTGQLLVNIVVENPSLDMLNFFQPQDPNIQLRDGTSTVELISLNTLTHDPFPAKILAQSKIAGQLTFPPPKSKQVTIQFKNLSFTSRPDLLFEAELPIDLTTPPQEQEVKGVVTPKRLPRQ